ncbi:hypothetical protein P6144_13050 [Sphingomonas sp. HITSZ_GF]|uniref:hypothetical protein n=1 Tax=Sphingomonas sp. HITSZ_GF TaxID=3037247 RepID=UPI00240E882B|nr:hypothetical protein [Sphingomonas sp. HITSZ_GF]MDG2534582.1 hypothetical protein [Sphingomonas sp. HITSZ_GF]
MRLISIPALAALVAMAAAPVAAQDHAPSNPNMGQSRNKAIKGKMAAPDAPPSGPVPANIGIMPCPALAAQITAATNIGIADAMSQRAAMQNARNQYNAMTARAQTNFGKAGMAKVAGARGAATALSQQAGAQLERDSRGYAQTGRNISAATPRVLADMGTLDALTKEYDRRCGGAYGAPAAGSAATAGTTEADIASAVSAASATPANTGYNGNPECADFPPAGQKDCERLLKPRKKG